ncbi:MAG: nitronate monooxygenase [Planctomycetales bacterium]|nr:nitronate monooxygenase [Planctomycetales bacterium]
MSKYPMIIQGGMGVAVSGWQLARAVAETGQLGVVSGTALDVVLVRRLQLGDPAGDLRRAFDAFPYHDIATRVWERYYIPGGKHPAAPFATCPLPSHMPTQSQQELLVLANFVEVYLAKEDHHGPIGINYLHKIQTSIVPSLFGAMFAGVDYVLMGAGIPRTIPGILDRLAEGLPCSLPIDVEGVSGDRDYDVRFDPRSICGADMPWLNRPAFLAIVASATLASMLTKKANGHVDGFVVECHTAGGHNAPPRGPMRLNERGEPIYGQRDDVDFEAFCKLDRPFWLAGGYGSPERLCEALGLGATGIQVGTAFAFCNESGLTSALKQQTLEQIRAGTLDVITDPVASPTGFPFKVLQLNGTLSDRQTTPRRLTCDLGYLRHAFERDDQSLGWRCPAERIDAYMQKGGEYQDTCGRQCLCNALLANVGLGQIRDGIEELPLLTSGDDGNSVLTYLSSDNGLAYDARDVVAHLLSQVANTTMSVP